MKTDEPLYAELGPGLLGQAFDSHQRPLSLQNEFMLNGNCVSALDDKREWEFIPNPELKENKAISGGDVIGYVYESSLFQKYKILFPPKAKGNIVYTASQGNYNIRENLVEVEKDGKNSKYTMSHLWALRMPRPVSSRILNLSMPMFTGQRILDTLYPLQTGETCSIYGQSGTGKTSILQGMAKCSSTDITVYVGCGETGNEMKSFYDNLSEFSITKKDVTTHALQKTCLIANLATESLAVRQLSVYLGTIFSEYFRDLGYNVLLAVDSISKWAESLSLCYQETASGSGYPTYVSSKVAYLCDRVGSVKCLGSSYREGSITLAGILAPMGTSGSEAANQALTVTSKTIWNLDKTLAQRRSYPAIAIRSSRTTEQKAFKQYFEMLDLEFSYFKRRMIEILIDSEDLEEIVQLIGLEYLDQEQRLVLKVAQMIREDFIEQDIFANHDSFSPNHKTIGIMRCILEFYEQAKIRITDLELSFNFILEKLNPFLKRISELKLADPSKCPKMFIHDSMELCEEMHRAFNAI